MGILKTCLLQWQLFHSENRVWQPWCCFVRPSTSVEHGHWGLHNIGLLYKYIQGDKNCWRTWNWSKWWHLYSGLSLSPSDKLGGRIVSQTRMANVWIWPSRHLVKLYESNWKRENQSVLNVISVLRDWCNKRGFHGCSIALQIEDV